MCDDQNHQGIVDPNFSRRGFGVGLAAAAAAAGGGAWAATTAERDVLIKTADGAADAVLFQPSGRGPWPAVLMWPDGLGLRPIFREMGARLAAEGYVVLVPNQYYRVRKAPIADGPVNMADPATRDKMMGFMRVVTPATTETDAKAFIAWLDALPEVDKTKGVGVHGYCMGGALTLRTAATVPGRVRAGASFHGGSLTTDQPDSPHLLIPRLKGGYVIAIADNDDMQQPQSKDILRKAFDDAKVPAKIEVYKGANHGWCVAGGESYNSAAAEKAWAELLALYKRHLA